VDGNPVCIDTQGVAGTGGMSMWTDPTQTDSRFLFKLFTNLTGDARATALCGECATKKVTWEGVYDGTTCLNVNPPLPPLTKSIGSSAPAPSPAAR
jgi:hypothetical protein